MATLILLEHAQAQTTPSGSMAYRFGAPKGGQDLSGFNRPHGGSPAHQRLLLQQKAAERFFKPYSGLGRPPEHAPKVTEDDVLAQARSGLATYEER